MHTITADQTFQSRGFHTSGAWTGAVRTPDTWVWHVRDTCPHPMGLPVGESHWVCENKGRKQTLGSQASRTQREPHSALTFPRFTAHTITTLLSAVVLTVFSFSSCLNWISLYWRIISIQFFVLPHCNLIKNLSLTVNPRTYEFREWQQTIKLRRGRVP